MNIKKVVLWMIVHPIEFFISVLIAFAVMPVVLREWKKQVDKERALERMIYRK